MRFYVNQLLAILLYIRPWVIVAIYQMQMHIIINNGENSNLKPNFIPI